MPRRSASPNRLPLAAALIAALLVGVLVGLNIRPTLAAGDAPPPRDLPAASLKPTATAPTGGRRGAAARAMEIAVTIEVGGTYGAGVLIVPAQGLVVTARHVVIETERSQAPMEVSFADGVRASGRVVESDPGLDLALVEIPPQPSRAAPRLGDVFELLPGDEVLAVGCPRHLPFSVSRGVVSYVGRRMDGARWLQTDIPINDGNSGGPVVDSEGRLVAITSFILRRAQGLSFALPVTYAVERFSRLAALARADELDRFRRWRGPLPVAPPR